MRLISCAWLRVSLIPRCISVLFLLHRRETRRRLFLFSLIRRVPSRNGAPSHVWKRIHGYIIRCQGLRELKIGMPADPFVGFRNFAIKRRLLRWTSALTRLNWTIVRLPDSATKRFYQWWNGYSLSAYDEFITLSG